MGTLYLVATPIGNLEDISPRAARLLGEVPLIAAEDTRHTGKLLAHLGVKTRMLSYHDHNKGAQTEQVVAALSQGDVALVSDAGTPGLNDPGYELVLAAINAGHTITPIPGPSAPVTALVASGLPTDTFLYLGYLPRKKQARQNLLQENLSQPHTLVFLETPHRLLDSLGDLRGVLGDRPIAVARELTKLHEEIVRGPISAAIAHFAQHAPRGEFTLVVGGYIPETGTWPEEKLRTEIEIRLARGEPASQVAKQLAKTSGWNRRDIYNLITQDPQ